MTARPILCRGCTKTLKTGALMDVLCEDCREKRSAASVPERTAEIVGQTQRQHVERIKRDQRVERVKRGGKT